MNKKNDIREQKTRTRRKKSEKNNNEKIEINRCIVCGREITKGDKFCTKCYTDIKKYNDEHERNIYIEDISEEFLEGLSNNYNHYEKKEDEKTGIKYIEMTYVYNYFRDNLIKNIDITFILLALFIVLISRMYEINPVLGFLMIIIYGGVCYFKNEYYKKKRKGMVIRFFSNMMIKSTKLIIDKREKVEYSKILDIKQYKKFKFLPTTLFFEEENKKGFLGRGVSIEDVYKLDEFAPLLVGITGYTEPKGEATKTVEELLKDSFVTIKNALIKDKNSKEKQNKNEEEKNDKK